MQFTELMQSARLAGDTWTLQVPDDWMQGRSAFGGLQAAFGVRAMRALVPAGVPLRTLQVTFIAPIEAGAMRARARVLRTGKNTAHVEAQLLDGEQVQASMIGVFGAGRQSAVSRALVQPAVKNDAAVELPFVPGVMPSFIQHFSARWLRGGIPFSGDQLPEAVIELGLRDTGPATEMHAVAMADFIPPVALSMVKTPTPGSSMTWMMEFLVDSFAHLSLQRWRVDAEMIAARDGYTNQSVTLWGSDGKAVALSYQSMVVFG